MTKDSIKPSPTDNLSSETASGYSLGRRFLQGRIDRSLDLDRPLSRLVRFWIDRDPALRRYESDLRELRRRLESEFDPFLLYSDVFVRPQNEKRTEDLPIGNSSGNNVTDNADGVTEIASNATDNGKNPSPTFPALHSGKKRRRENRFRTIPRAAALILVAALSVIGGVSLYLAPSPPSLSPSPSLSSPSPNDGVVPATRTVTQAVPTDAVIPVIRESVEEGVTPLSTFTGFSDYFPEWASVVTSDFDWIGFDSEDQTDTETAKNVPFWTEYGKDLVEREKRVVDEMAASIPFSDKIQDWML